MSDQRHVRRPSHVRSERIFEDSTHPVPTDNELVKLGELMKKPAAEDRGRGTSNIPSGYVYLAQFVNHDITYDWTPNTPHRKRDPTDTELKLAQQPILNLGSMYGGGPDLNPELYEDDRKLKLGTTTKRVRFGVNDKFQNDLPRNDGTKEAIIGNPLNDQNLVVAQTHVAFLKFHNSVVDCLGNGASLDEARKVVVQHYQSIVLHDLLPMLLDKQVLSDVIGPKGPFLQIPKGELPLEFASATFRFGHSMVRDEYNWNRVFNAQGEARYGVSLWTLFELAKLTGDLGGFPTLPSDWVVDWRFFYKFKDSPHDPNYACLIDTELARQLHYLPDEESSKSLAVRDLLKGKQSQLLTGQEVAEKYRAKIDNGYQPPKITHPLKNPNHDFSAYTPLWYYILQEAAQPPQGGQHLGKVGSFIVAETFRAMLEYDTDSIWGRDWKPDPKLMVNKQGNTYTMVDLLSFVARSSKQFINSQNQQSEINPLGDA